MSREAHVPFCDGLAVQFHWSTHLSYLPSEIRGLYYYLYLIFVTWYNTVHRHSGLNFVRPVQRHTQVAESVMRQRIEVYEAARARQPRRWSKEIRDWSLPDSVWLNPVKEAKPEMAKAAYGIRCRLA